MVQASVVEEPEEASAEPATEAEIFLKEWAKDTIKRNIPFLNETLRSLLSLAIGLSGASMIFMGAGVRIQFRAVAVLFFLASAVISLLGASPYEGQVSFFCPADIETHKAKALRFKLASVRWATGLILAGIVAGLTGWMSGP